ncbi:hypothetical protein [Denitromonas ohlonensis]|uniref:Uncharacterized protein n=2 Tax=Denitromonas TaxID=139331 RepID=A0A557SEX7_9RHOO|nr:hypothetical protein [Denitromonas ohlonensis]TVT46865.1 MAG: hypothetical protein FHP94_16725 [Denitromonas halophila]TVO64086.1 hypothetical protein FHP90_12290 [Denitromonas ohlonensis]TVO75987.1 hypothetical protein FHP89_10965 [Denitromonas ohlonensis]TVT73304.1 MAG: hypothetical protein FHP93_06560 [Denitromonas halophila]TVT77373.1 MAG: hypothetical protein FHP92_04150 [Denitromonas halophila]
MSLIKALTTAAFFMLLASPVAARTSAPIINHTGVTWSPSSGQHRTLDQVQAAIVRACQKKNWSVATTADENAPIATLVVRNKHTIRTSIRYSTAPSTLAISAAPT